MTWTKYVLRISSCFRNNALDFCVFSRLNIKTRCNFNHGFVRTNANFVVNSSSVLHFSNVSNQQVMIDSIEGNLKIRSQLKEESIISNQSDHIKVLKNVLRISSTKVYRILKKCPELVTCDLASVSTNVENLKKRGMTVERILSMPWLISLGSDVTDKKCEEVKKVLRINTFACAAPFLEIPVKRLHQTWSLWESELLDVTRSTDGTSFANRIDYLADKMKSENIEVADMMMKVSTIMSAALPIVEEKLNVLLDYGVESEDIIKDPYIFMFSASAIESRLKNCQVEGLDIVKPWMLRCTMDAFNFYVQRINHERELRHGHKDIVDFLKEKLDCEVSEAKEILLRVPSVKKASAIKLNEMIQFLYSHGFTANQIIEAPRVLGHSVETIDERIRELASYGYNPQFLNTLCQTSTNYASFIRRLRIQSNSNKTSAEVGDRLNI